MKSLILLLIPGFAFAANISADQFSAITEVDQAVQAKLIAGCNDFPYLMASDKKKCLQMAKENRYTSAVVETCLKEKSNALACLGASKESSVPDAVMKGCSQATMAKSADDGVGACIRFFRDSSSVFDQDAASFCLDKERNFRLARRCLNAIRDREIDLDALKKCASKTAYQSLKEDVMDCVEKVTATAPLKTDAICTRKNPVKASGGGRFTGTR